MEIKKRLSAAAKRLTPQIEASNTAIELGRLCDRLEELLTYAEHREERRIESEKSGKSFAQRQEERKQAAIKANQDAQAEAEAEAEAAREEAVAATTGETAPEEEVADTGETAPEEEVANAG